MTVFLLLIAIALAVAIVLVMIPKNLDFIQGYPAGPSKERALQSLHCFEPKHKRRSLLPSAKIRIS